MTRRKNDLEITIRVRVPAELTGPQIKREIRTLINDQTNWLTHYGDDKQFELSPGDIRVSSVGRIKRLP